MIEKIANKIVADLAQSLINGMKRNINDIENIKKKSDKGKMLINDINREFKTLLDSTENLREMGGEEWKVKKLESEIEDIAEYIRDAKMVNYSSKYIENICDKMIEMWKKNMDMYKDIYQQHGHMVKSKENEVVRKLTVAQVREICPACADKMEKLHMTEVREDVIKKAAWETLPKGWTKKSLEKYWASLTGDVKHKVTKCIKELKGKISDSGAFCASIADKLDPGWRSRSSSINIANKIVKIAKEMEASDDDFEITMKEDGKKYNIILKQGGTDLISFEAIDEDRAYKLFDGIKKLVKECAVQTIRELHG